MINEEIKLNPKILESDIEQRATRDGYGDGLVLAGQQNKDVVVLCADLTDSTRSQIFKDKFPERFIEMGIAEQNMASVAAGMSLAGKIPFISSYGMFNPGRNWEQIRTTVCYNEANVKIGVAHCGVSVGPDGGTHQSIEDIAILRCIPNITLIAPADYYEAKKAVLAISKIYGPAAIRFNREKTPILTTEDTPFEIGKAFPVFKPKNLDKVDAVIIACGPLIYNAILAAKSLEDKGLSIAVLNNHTIKPMDEEHIIMAAKKAGAVITVEEHQVQGGMGSTVAEILAKNYPVPIEFIGVQNRFGESGLPSELLEKFEMGVGHIIEAVKKVIGRKNK